MPTLGEIWRAGIDTIACKRKCAALQNRINSLQRERPALLRALGEAAWSAGAVGKDYSRTATELFALDEKLQEAKEAEAGSTAALAKAEEQLEEAKRHYSSRINEVSRPFNAAKKAFREIEKRFEQLKRDRTNLQQTIPLLQESAKHLVEKIAELQGVAEAAAEVARLRSDLQRRRQDAEEAETRLKEAQKAISSLRPDLEDKKRELESQRAELKALETEARERLGALGKDREEARDRLRESNRAMRACQDGLEPLFYQLGEEVNVRRLGHEELGEHYPVLDDQMVLLRDLHTRLSGEEANLAAIDKGAVRWFWGLLIGSGALVVAAAVPIALLIF